MKTCCWLAIALLLASTVQAADWRFGKMSIQWLDGFKKTPSNVAERFVGPNGEVVLVTSIALRDGADAKATAKSFIDFGEWQLPELSFAKCKDFMESKREELKGQVTLFSTAGTIRREPKMFYLQFLAVSPAGHSALFTVEGTGDPAIEWKRFRPLFDSIKWKIDRRSG